MSPDTASPAEAPPVRWTRAAPRPWYHYLQRALTHPQAVVGGWVSVILFLAVRRFSDDLTAAVVAGGWGLAVTVFSYLRRRRANVFAALTTVVALISLTATLLAQDVNWYLAEAAFSRALYGLLFLGSLLLPRSLAQVIVEETTGSAWTDEFRASETFKRPLRRVTAVWGIERLIHAAVLIVMQFTLPVETYLALRVALGWPVDLALLAFSAWYPSRYWRRAWQQQARARQAGQSTAGEEAHAKLSTPS
ncbi:MAG: hypothetical protein JW910_01890 [Anaerolineae bacterium]|nr:hypothetical protein [Anaerolineae bacterium]